MEVGEEEEVGEKVRESEERGEGQRGKENLALY